MKKLLTLALLAIALPASAQLTTNVTVSITVSIPTVSTNTTSGTLNYSQAADRNLIDGWAWMFDKARAGGYTNRFDRYLGQVRILDDVKASADAYNAEQNRLLIEALTALLTIHRALLSTQNISDLQAIADLAP